MDVMFYDRAGGAIDVRRLHEQVGGAAGAHYTRSETRQMFLRASLVHAILRATCPTRPKEFATARKFFYRTQNAPLLFFLPPRRNNKPRESRTRVRKKFVT